jgi:hypothetical protein
MNFSDPNAAVLAVCLTSMPLDAERPRRPHAGRSVFCRRDRRSETREDRPNSIDRGQRRDTVCTYQDRDQEGRAGQIHAAQ